MASASAKWRLQLPHDSLLTGLLFALRRDAYIMEAFNYGTPAIADHREFEQVFRHLYYDQIRRLFDDDVLLLAAIEAYPEYSTKGFTEPDVLVAFGHPSRDLGIYPTPAVKQRGPSLAACIDRDHASQEIWDFCKSNAPKCASHLADFSGTFSTDTGMVAPYLVRPVEPAPKNLSYNELLSIWSRTQPLSDLLYSVPFSSGERSDRLKDFRKPYYSAVLGVYPKKQSVLAVSESAWLEVLHLSFQMAWGSPTLGKLRETIELDEQKRLLLEAQALRDGHLQLLADEVSHTIEEHTAVIRREAQRLITALAPPMERGLDEGEAAIVFIQGKTIHAKLPLHGVHDPDKRIRGILPSPVIIKGLTHFALLRILDSDATKEPALTSYAQLSDVALEAISKKAASPAFSKLLTHLHQGDKSAFLLLKELIYSPNYPNREASFYSLISRLMLGAVNADFCVRIIGSESGTQLAEVFPHDFLSKAFGKAPTLEDTDDLLYQYPVFPALPGIPHRDWFSPFVEMIAHYLQVHKPDDKVFVSRVDISLGNPVHLTCQLSGNVERINWVFSRLADAEVAGSGGHDMRGCWLRLPPCCQPKLNPDEKTIHFLIG